MRLCIFIISITLLWPGLNGCKSNATYGSGGDKRPAKATTGSRTGTDTGTESRSSKRPSDDDDAEDGKRKESDPEAAADERDDTDTDTAPDVTGASIVARAVEPLLGRWKLRQGGIEVEITKTQIRVRLPDVAADSTVRKIVGVEARGSYLGLVEEENGKRRYCLYLVEIGADGQPVFNIHCGNDAFPPNLIKGNEYVKIR
jgi:hypothetical protein